MIIIGNYLIAPLKKCERWVPGVEGCGASTRGGLSDPHEGRTHETIDKATHFTPQVGEKLSSEEGRVKQRAQASRQILSKAQDTGQGGIARTIPPARGV